ncbi:Tagatose-6-phosphate kinase [Streptomyces sp. YIM 130001]|uniref:1-phosphofructokinase family hexose kinase n=1 Tax=Streptomyces sp. YIM 130001 TaxID=2259644 RepID=UPI000E657A8B|nr:1-phosphofructokinase family hexose kinase [Streptomyces sp. YIM 130001]RII13735.1 Tagatose-6-phosphate kinase [Streptomyces sp. YIM 130001]
MILTVTLNTALDITYRVPRLTPHASHRVTAVTERPGGKGLNVARVLAALGHEVTVTGFAGGTTGETLRSLLADDAKGGSGHGDPQGRNGAAPKSHNHPEPPTPRSTALTDALIPTSGTTRRTVAVVDGETGDTTQLNEPGPLISSEEWNALLGACRDLLPSASAVALCGSLPPGVPVGAYAHLVRAARAMDVPVLLDTSGAPLRRGIAARPDLIKPNAAELAELTGHHEPLRAVRDARRRGAHGVVASLGADGLLAVTPEGGWRAAPPAPVRGNPTGAGDSAVAALLAGIARGDDWPARLSSAVALSAATVAAPVAGEFDRSTYVELHPRVTVTEVATVPPSAP